MMPIIKLSIAFALVFGAHETGHFVEADNYGGYCITGIGMDGINMTIKEPESRIYGGGFMGQQHVANATRNRYVYLISGIHKAGYLTRTTGDISNMEAIGQEYTRIPIAMSVVSDIAMYLQPDSNWSLAYDHAGNHGTPIIKLQGRF